MNDRYVIVEKPADRIEDRRWEIYDTIRGDVMFGSYTTEDRAKKFAAKKNAQWDLAKLHGIRGVEYKGPKRSVKNVPYRTPRAIVVKGKPKGKTEFFEVKNGLVIYSYE